MSPWFPTTVREKLVKLVIISGFLGSGKTTLLLALVRRLSASGAGKIVIVENEVGAVGIDNQYLTMEGLQVRELYAGCVCCTLASDLVTTVRQIAEVLSPDVVFVEPSGVARPDNLVDTVRRYGREVSDIRVLGLLDATRYEVIKEVVEPLLESTIATADLVAINKADLCSGEEMAAIEADVLARRPDATVIPISATEGTNLGEVVARL
jgi:G3E family GTPase